ncbi:MAG TPA: RidA family protein [Gemmatimonadaceae bacterium]|nr:RidA family protein [Gemmatimonadaceae bacterium]
MSVSGDAAPNSTASDIVPEGWPRGVGYAHAIAARGRIVSVAGQVGWDPRTRAWHHRDLPGQTAQALRNIVEIVGAAGGKHNDIVRLTWFLTDRDQYIAARREIGDVYRALFGRHYPAMSVVVVSGLIEPEALVEIEATAVVPD